MRSVPPLLALQVDHHAGAGGVGSGGWVLVLVLPSAQSTLRPLKPYQIWLVHVDMGHEVMRGPWAVSIRLKFSPRTPPTLGQVMITLKISLQPAPS
jgi:hypothetical protein